MSFFVRRWVRTWKLSGTSWARIPMTPPSPRVLSIQLKVKLYKRRTKTEEIDCDYFPTFFISKPFFFCHHLLVSLSFIKTSGANLQPSVIADWTQRDMCNAIVEFWCWYVVVLCAALFFPRGSIALNLLLGFSLRLWQTLWTRLWTYFRHKKR